MWGSLPYPHEFTTKIALWSCILLISTKCLWLLSYLLIDIDCNNNLSIFFYFYIHYFGIYGIYLSFYLLLDELYYSIKGISLRGCLTLYIGDDLLICGDSSYVQHWYAWFIQPLYGLHHFGVLDVFSVDTFCMQILTNKRNIFIYWCARSLHLWWVCLSGCT